VTVALTGRSLSSYVCASCLARKGIECEILTGGDRTLANPPVLVLNDACLALLRDLFPAVAWMEQGYALQHREVLWGEDPQPRRIDQVSMVVTTETLLQRLEEQIGTGLLRSSIDSASTDYRWVVNPRDQDPIRVDGGKRVLVSATTRLARDVDPPRSLMESMLEGWLYLAPASTHLAIVQAMLPARPDEPDKKLRDMLGQSSLIGPHVVEIGLTHVFEAAPSMSLPLINGRTLRMSGAAARLDPVSGEGTPFALRCAILAAAVMSAPGRDLRLGQHYMKRVIQSYLSHLEGCFTFYHEAFPGHAGWQEELTRLHRAYGQLLAAHRSDLSRPFGFRLEGLRLVQDSGS